MRFYISTDTQSFITEPAFRAPVNSVSFKRGDTAQVNIQFVSGSTALSAVSGKLLKFGLKEEGDYDGDYVVYQTAYTTSGNDFVMVPSFNTDALNLLLGHDPLSGNILPDVAAVDTMLEVSWSDDSGTSWYSTNTITATINNDVNKGNEGTPLATADPVDWLVANQMAFDSTPYVVQVSLLSGVALAPTALYPTISGSVYSSNGSLTAAAAGNWFDLRYSSGDSGWLVDWYVDGIQSAQDSQWLLTSAEALPPAGIYAGITTTDPNYEYVRVVTTTEDTKNTHRFLANSNNEYGNNELYVNIGGSSENQNWRKITTTAI